MAVEITQQFPNELRDRVDAIPGRGQYYKCWQPSGETQYEVPYAVIQPESYFSEETKYSPVRAVLAAPHSLCAIWLLAIPELGSTQPCGIRIVLRGGWDSIQEELFVGDFSPPDVKAQGLLIQVSGLLCTQYELWARAIDNKTNGVAAKNMKIVCGFMLGHQHAGTLQRLVGQKYYTP